MNRRRGDGVGIEVTDDVVRAVLLRHDAPGRIGNAVTVAIEHGGPADRQLLDAFVRAAAALEPITAVPTRIAWFPSVATVQAFDATDDPATAILRLDDQGAEATLAVSGGGLRLLGMRWPSGDADEVADIARSAGFHDPHVEPAPLSLARAGPGAVYVAVRVTGHDRRWAALVAGGVPLLAAPIEDVDAAPDPALAMWPLDRVAAALDDVADDLIVAPVLVSRLQHVATAAGTRTPVRPSPSGLAGAVDPGDIVALGAAIAAARLAGRNRVVATPARPGMPDGDRGAAGPWAVERLPDPVGHGDPASRWAAVLCAVRRRRARHRAASTDRRRLPLS